MKVSLEEPRLNAAAAQPHRFGEARTVGISTLGGWWGWPSRQNPSAGAGSLAPEICF